MKRRGSLRGVSGLPSGAYEVSCRIRAGCPRGFWPHSPRTVASRHSTGSPAPRRRGFGRQGRRNFGGIISVSSKRRDVKRDQPRGSGPAPPCRGGAFRCRGRASRCRGRASRCHGRASRCRGPASRYRGRASSCRAADARCRGDDASYVGHGHLVSRRASSEDPRPTHRASRAHLEVSGSEHRGVAAASRTSVPHFRAPPPRYRAPSPPHRASPPRYRAPRPQHEASPPPHRAASPRLRAPSPRHRTPSPLHGVSAMDPGVSRVALGVSCAHLDVSASTYEAPCRRFFVSPWGGGALAAEAARQRGCRRECPHPTCVIVPRRSCSTPAEPEAQVAQLVEQRTENPRVGGSIPSLGTTAKLDPSRRDNPI